VTMRGTVTEITLFLSVLGTGHRKVIPEDGKCGKPVRFLIYRSLVK
jgi:hypothetical protein